MGFLELIVDGNDMGSLGDADFVAGWEKEYPNAFVAHAGDDTVSDDFSVYTGSTLGWFMPRGGLIDADYKWQILDIRDATASIKD
ncbi:MAG: hypothetical protein V3V08_11980 [Nannocystaceae bacterium]